MNDATRDERARNPQQQLPPKGRPPEQRRRRNKRFRATAWLPEDPTLARTMNRPVPAEDGHVRIRRCETYVIYNVAGAGEDSAQADFSPRSA